MNALMSNDHAMMGGYFVAKQWRCFACLLFRIKTQWECHALCIDLRCPPPPVNPDLTHPPTPTYCLPLPPDTQPSPVSPYLHTIS